MSDLKNFKFRNQKSINSIEIIDETEIEVEKSINKIEENPVTRPLPEQPINMNKSVKKIHNESFKSVTKQTEDAEKKSDKKNCLIS